MPPEKEPKSTTSYISAALRDMVDSPESMTNTAMGSCEASDMLITIPRVGHVVSNVLANGKTTPNFANDAPHPDSVFENAIYNDGNSDNGLTPTGWGVFSLPFVGLAAGLIRGAYQRYRKRKLTSYDYLKEKVQPFTLQSAPSTEEITNTLNQLLAKGKIEGRTDYEIDGDNQTQIRLKRKNNEKPSAQIEQMSVEDAKIFKPNPVLNAIYKLTGTGFSRGINKVWDFLNQNSYVFWIGWFPLMIGVGLATMGAAPFYAAISLIPPAVYSVGMLTWKFGRWVKSKITGKAVTEEAAPDPESEAILSEAIQRYYMKKEHAHYQDKILSAAGWDREAWAGQKNAIKNAEKIDIANRKPSSAQAVLDSQLARYLLGSKLEQRTKFTTGIAKNWMLGYACTSFLLWLGSTILLAPVGLSFLPTVVAGALISGSAVMGGGLVGAIASSAIGTFFGIKSAANQHVEQLKFKQKVYEKLSAPYKDENISKLEKFNHLEKLVNEKKEHIKQLRGQLSNKKHAIQGDERKKILFDYKLNEVDVYNDYYFEKQTQKPSLWTSIKKFGNRSYEFLGGGQTWVFLARSLFLAGVGAALIAGSFVGAPLAFLAIAAGFAMLGGCVRLIQYQLNRNQQHRELFVDTFDARISYLRKKDKELGGLEAALTAELQSSSSVSNVLDVPKSEPDVGKKFAPQLVQQMNQTLESAKTSSPKKESEAITISTTKKSKGEHDLASPSTTPIGSSWPTLHGKKGEKLEEKQPLLSKQENRFAYSSSK